MEVQALEHTTERCHGIFEAHFSFVIYGAHEQRWVAYAFDNTEFDGEELLNKIFPCEGVHADPIVSDDDTDAERPIWDPRLYFLKVVRARLAQAATEWDALFWAIERRIVQYVSCPTSICLEARFGVLIVDLEREISFNFIPQPTRSRRHHQNI